MRRCWTFQEAVISAGKLHVQFKDGTYDFPEDLCHLRAGNDIGTYMREPAIDPKHRDIAEKGLVFGLQAYEVYKGKMNPIQLIQDPFKAKQAEKEYDENLLTADQLLEKPTGIISISARMSMEVKLFFKSMISLWAQQPRPGIEMYSVDRARRIVDAWQGLRYRTTSRESDRFINFSFACAKSKADFEILERILCCNSPLHSGTSKDGPCPEPSLPREDRFRAWIDEQPVLPAGLLFVKGEKMQEAGYRWAPKTVFPEDITDDEIIIRRSKGPKQEAPYDSRLEICRQGWF